MQNDILEMLNGEITRLTKHLGTLTPGTEEYSNVKQDLVDLYDRRAKERAGDIAAEELELKERNFIYNEDKDNNETLLRQQEIDEHKKDRFVGVATDLGKFGLALGAFGLATFVGMKFEETGSLTSRIFSESRGVLSKILFRG